SNFGLEDLAYPASLLDSVARPPDSKDSVFIMNACRSGHPEIVSTRIYEYLAHQTAFVGANYALLVDNPESPALKLFAELLQNKRGMYLAHLLQRIQKLSIDLSREDLSK